MRKGTKFIKVEIEKNGMRAYVIDKHQQVSKFDLTRRQRKIFEQYFLSDFLDRVRAEFNADVIDENFVITNESKTVYPISDDE